MENSDFLWLIGGLKFLLGYGFGVLLGIYLWSAERDERARNRGKAALLDEQLSVETEGRVVDIRRTEVAAPAPEERLVLVCTFESLSGSEHRFEEEVPASASVAALVGSTVEVRYLVSDPSVATLWSQGGEPPDPELPKIWLRFVLRPTIIGLVALFIF